MKVYLRANHPLAPSSNSPTPYSPSIAESAFKLGFREERGLGGEFGGQQPVAPPHASCLLPIFTPMKAYKPDCPRYWYQ
jgi:hypothetical protein